MLLNRKLNHFTYNNDKFKKMLSPFGDSAQKMLGLLFLTWSLKFHMKLVSTEIFVPDLCENW